MKKKVNPRHRPATQADVNKAKKTAKNEAMEVTLGIVLTVLRDKKGYDEEEMRSFWNDAQYLSDSILKGYVSIHDLIDVLKEDGYELRL